MRLVGRRLRLPVPRLLSLPRLPLAVGLRCRFATAGEGAGVSAWLLPLAWILAGILKPPAPRPLTLPRVAPPEPERRLRCD